MGTGAADGLVDRSTHRCAWYGYAPALEQVGALRRLAPLASRGHGLERWRPTAAVQADRERRLGLDLISLHFRHLAVPPEFFAYHVDPALPGSSGRCSQGSRTETPGPAPNPKETRPCDS